MTLRIWTLASVAVAAMIFATPAYSAMISGSEWIGWRASDQTAYVVGVYDSLTTFASSEEDAKGATHYRNCIGRSKMTGRQMSENIKAFVQTKPELHTGPMAVAVAKYFF